MTWRDRVRPASFRGVGFLVDGDTIPIGRRVHTHEFMRRDEPYTEDLGRVADWWSFDAYLIGVDYDEHLERLKAALAAPGAGELVHPTVGPVQAICDGGASSISHTARHGGMATLSLKFVEAGAVRSPGVKTDTPAQLVIAAEDLRAASRAAFADGFVVSGWPDMVETLSREFAADLGFTLPTAGTLDQVFDVIEAGTAADTVAAGLSRVASLPSTALSAATPSRARVATNAAALVQATREASVAGVAANAAQAWPVYDDAVIALAGVATLIDAAYLTAPDPVVQALTTLRAATLEHIRAEMRVASRLRTETPIIPTPANVLAWRLYADADRDAEIIARNGLTTPADASGDLRVLES